MIWSYNVRQGVADVIAKYKWQAENSGSSIFAIDAFQKGVKHHLSYVCEFYAATKTVFVCPDLDFDLKIPNDLYTHMLQTGVDSFNQGIRDKSSAHVSNINE